MKKVLFINLLFVSFVGHAGGTAIVTVGADALCDYENITAASFQEPASDLLEIRVPKNYSLPGLELLANRNTSIIGGYDTCTDTTVSEKTVLTGNDSSAIFVAGVSESLTERTVLNMVNLEISGGNSADNGGVLNLIGSWNLTLNNTTLRFNNSDQDGGAIAIGPAENSNVLLPRVFVSGNSILSNNTATNGGAIACNGGGFVSVWESQLAFNESVGFGGAVYMNNGCNFYQYGGRLFQGVIFNDAGQSGGGIAALDDSLIFIDSNRYNIGAALISSNSAPNGGGIFVSGESRLEAIDAIINNNTATFTGGGIRSTEGHINIRRLSPGAQCHNEIRCSMISNNSVSSSDPSFVGGGAIATFGGSLEIKGTYIENNSASSGSAIKARLMPFEFDSNFTMVGNVVAGNRNAPQVIYFDDASGEIAFTTFVDNEDMDRVIEMAYPTTSLDGNEVRVSGSIFVHSDDTLPSAELTTAGQLPVGDCNRNEPNSTGDLVAQPRSLGTVVSFEDQPGGDYRIVDNTAFIDYCNGSFLGLGSNVSANGLPRPVDNSRPNSNGTYELGGLERYKLDLIFKDNF